MMTVKILINGELKGTVKFTNRGPAGGAKTRYSVQAFQEVDPKGKPPFWWNPRDVFHIPDQGMIQLLANGLAAMGWKPKPWALDVSK